MNRMKLVAVALACTLAMSACVDDKESTSVENLRNAKAKQLEALASYSNAQAESTKLLAEAEAALKMAQAEGLRIANELEGIELEIAKAGLQSRLEIQKLELETALKNAEAALLIAKANLIAAQDNITIAEMRRIQTLIAKVDGALSTLNSYKRDLVDLGTRLIAAEFDLKSAEAAKEEIVARNQRTIATQNALLAEYAKYNKEDKAAAEKLADDAKATYKALSDKSVLANAKYTDVRKSMGSAFEALRGTKLMQAGFNHGQYVERESVEAFKKEFTYSNGYNDFATSATSNASGVPFEFYTVNTSKLSADVSNKEREVTIAKSVKAEAEKVLTDKKEEQGYKDAQKAVVDAKKEFADAETAAEQEAARLKIQATEWALKDYAEMEESSFEQAKEELENVTADLAELKNIQTALTSEENVKAYDAAKVALEAAIVVELDARIAAAIAGNDASMQNELATNLRNLADGYADVDSLIASAKKNIIQAEKAIEAYGDVKTQEQLIAQYKIDIAQCEQNIIEYEAIYKTYKDQLDAIITGK